MVRLEPLLATVLPENAGRFESALETAVQLFKRFALAGLYEQVVSFFRAAPSWAGARS
jgi:hypothetical protein